MHNTTNRTVAAIAMALLSACGGGSDSTANEDEADEEVVVPAHPMDKYLGSYSYCDRDYTREWLTITKASDGTYKSSVRTVVYENADCTGSALGTMSRSPSPTLQHLSNEVVPARIEGLPASLAVDLLRLTWINGKLNLEGPGVSGNCLSYPKGYICYGAADLNRVTEARMYLSDTALYMLDLEDGGYIADEIYVRIN